MRKYIAFLVMFFFLPSSVHAGRFYDQSWEFSTIPNVSRDTTNGFWYHGNCFSKVGGDLFNSIELSGKYARLGNKSVRLFRHSLYPNSKGHGICESFVKNETDRHRNEIRYGYGKAGFQSWIMGDERWFRQSIYIPSDEGNFSSWNASSKMIMLMQVIGANPGATHELSFNLTGGPKIVVEAVYGTTATEGTETHVNLATLSLKKDAWNDVIVRTRRSWQTPAQNPTGHGLVKVWLNCSDWTQCAPAVDYSGPSAIRWMTDQWFKTGLYGNISTWDHQHVVYMDAIKMGIRESETEAQMLGLMAADFGVVPSPPEPPASFTVD